MKNLTRKQRISKHLKNKINEHPIVKFTIVLALLIIYMIITVYKFGFKDGIFVSLLSWSFFVFCTPVADAGLLLDFPLRLITGIRMIYSEIIVWVIALFLNIIALTTTPTIYSKTMLLSLFYQILSNPIPHWTIIILSALGTFLSIHFGDEVMDIAEERFKQRKRYKRHVRKYRIIIFLFIIVLLVILYDFLLNSLGIKIPLI